MRSTAVQKEIDRILTRFDIKHPRDFSIGMGWIPIVEKAFERMVAAGWNKKLAQVKEKFGGLRIYTGDRGNEEIYAAVADAEAACWKTCENCGKPGKPDNREKWVVTLCKKCRAAKVSDHGNHRR